MAPAPLLWSIVCDVCETFLFGIYTALFVFSTVFLLSKSRRTWTRNLVLAASVAMYTASATHWAINIALLARAARNSSVVEIVMTPIEEIASHHLPTINYAIGDAIVVWRAWVLWGRRRDLFIPPILFLLGTIATSVTSAVLTFKGAGGDISARLGYSVWGLSILTNLWVTASICIKAWQHRHFLRSLMGKSTPRTRAEKALAFLIESGAIYLCIWVASLVVHTTSPDGPLMSHAVIVQLVGIYPTVIIVVVTMRLSTADVLLQPGHPKQLAPPTPIMFASRSPHPASFDDSTCNTCEIASSRGSISSQTHGPTFTAK
ncbi:hypothetical protein BC834DRAFT_1042207 [Gloeopeniophorella convolvens]|nr:hypothetical protein BC834DRAFT_1042207 [Gloeopeniophorella convolvens]